MGFELKHGGGIAVLDLQSQRVTSLASKGKDPAWSPDGRQVAFGGFAASQAGLWIFDVERGGAFQVAKNPGCTMPAWSPDGERLAFDLRRQTNEVWILNTRSLPREPVLTDQLPTRAPSGPRLCDSPVMALVDMTVPGPFKLPLLEAGEFTLPNPQNHEHSAARFLDLGGIPWYTNHTLHHYPRRFARDQHPEFYADDGGGKLCYSSAALARQVAQDARDYFDGKTVPDLTLPPGSVYYPVVPEDAARFCRCAECRRWLDPHVNDVPRTPSGRALFNDGRISHLWFSFVNQVARELRRTHPDKYLCTLACETYNWYPTGFRLESNVAIAPCMQTRNYWHMPLTWSWRGPTPRSPDSPVHPGH